MGKQTLCIIIEDQLPAQRILQRYLADLPSIKLVGIYEDCLSALSVLMEEPIDLILLDINLPKISGLNFLRSLHLPPKVIITTAYPQYALEGFELDVLDYLLKPISFDRFLMAIGKLNRNIGPTPLRPQITPPIASERSEKFIFVKSDKVLHRVDFEMIIYVEADGDFVHVVTTERKHLLSHTLKYWNTILPEHVFIQVHRSFIVNLAYIHQIRGNEIKLAARSIPIGRSYKAQLLRKIEKLLP